MIKTILKKLNTALMIVIIVTMSLIISASSMAANDPFIDAGFIQARKQVTAFDFTLEDINGNPIRLTDYRGKVVMLFFWTTW